MRAVVSGLKRDFVFYKSKTGALNNILVAGGLEDIIFNPPCNKKGRLIYYAFLQWD
jgi:hypothetical protein